MQVGPQRRLFLCSIEQTVKEICTFRVGGFPVRISLSVFWTWSRPKVVYKINKSTSLHPSQILEENFGGNNLKQRHCDLPVTEFRICYKFKEISPSLNTENRIRILGDDNGLGGDDSVPTSGEGRVDFQKLSRYIVNAGGLNKRPSKAFGNTITNSIRNSSCTSVHEVPTETTNS